MVEFIQANVRWNTFPTFSCVLLCIFEEIGVNDRKWDINGHVTRLK